jgi:outer membrane protein TolC
MQAATTTVCCVAWATIATSLAFAGAPPRRDAASSIKDIAAVSAAQEDADLLRPPSPAEDDDRVDLEWKPTESGRMTIDLSSALELATRINPRIGIAQEGVQEALALDLGARAMLLPTLTAGTNYHLHSGKLQTSFGEIRTINEQSIYFGGGARTLAAETVAIPAVRLFGHLGDAYYMPLAARQVVAQRHSEVHATTNVTLLDVAVRYLQLAQAETRLEALSQMLQQLQETVQITRNFAELGQGRYADYHRAQARGVLLLMELKLAEEAAADASAELAQLLCLDQSVQLTTPSAPMELIVLTPMDVDPDYLLEVAFARRPDLIAQNSAIAAADVRVRQEVMRPWLPVLSVGFSAGAFGGGSDRQDLGVSSFFQRLGTRTDFDVLAVWQVQNLGHGNQSLQGMRRAERDEAIQVRSVTINQIRREVIVARSQMQAARNAVGVAQIQMQAADLALEQDLARTKAGEGRPIETLNSFDLAIRARQKLIDAATDFNLAQFKLFVAIGETPLLPPE